MFKIMKEGLNIPQHSQHFKSLNIKVLELK